MSVKPPFLQTFIIIEQRYDYKKRFILKVVVYLRQTNNAINLISQFFIL